jgi:hypothetical protein
MRKLVPESIDEALQISKKKELNEAKVGDLLKKAAGAVKGIFKKVGQFFVNFYEKTIVPVFAPVNIGVLVKGGTLNNVGYVPSDEDVALEPELASLKGGKSMIDRARTEYQHY